MSYDPTFRHPYAKPELGLLLSSHLSKSFCGLQVNQVGAQTQATIAFVAYCTQAYSAAMQRATQQERQVSWPGM